MITLSLAAVAGVVLVGVVFLLRPVRPRQTPPLPVVALPLALLFVAAPIPVIAYQSILDFQSFAAAGQSGLKAVAGLVLNILRPMWFGCLGFLVVIGGAAALQLFRGPADVGDAAPAADRGRFAWVFYLSSALLIPAAAQVYLLREVATVVMAAGVALTPDRGPTMSGPAPLVLGMSLPEVSEFVAQRLIVGVLGGIVVTLIVAGFVVVNLAAHRLGGTTPGLDRLSRWVTVAAVSFGLVTLFLLTAAIRSVAAL